jgi:hypothetical protein
MQHIKGILLASSVTAEQIMEERFDSGKIGAGPGVDAESFQGTIEFSKSGQTVRSRTGADAARDGGSERRRYSIRLPPWPMRHLRHEIAGGRG